MLNLNVPMIDYYRVTTFDPVKYESLLEYMTQDVPTLHQTSVKRYKGFKLGELFAGRGQQKGVSHFLAQCSGASSHYTFPDISSLDWGRARRVDLQMTVNLNHELLFDWYLKVRELGIGGVRDTQSGTTIYIGSRQSNRMWRVYKKDDNMVRFEVETKGDLAEIVWKEMSENGMESVAGIFLSELQRLMKKVVAIPQMYAVLDEIKNMALKIANNEGDLVLQVPKPRSNTRKWLETTVDSSVRKLLNDHDESEEVLNWLKSLVEYGEKLTQQLELALD